MTDNLLIKVRRVLLEARVAMMAVPGFTEMHLGAPIADHAISSAIQRCPPALAVFLPCLGEVPIAAGVLHLALTEMA